MNSDRGEELLRAWCSLSTKNFTKYFFWRLKRKKFIVNDHHEIIWDALDKVVDGVIKNLIINIAPRYSKTELVVKNFIPYGLSLNPSAKFIHLSYSDDLALDNSEEIRYIVKSEEYQQLYPYVQVSQSTDSKKKWSTTEGGGVYATSTGGQVTGFGAGEVYYEDEESSRLLNEIMSDIASMNQYETESFAGAIIIDDPLKPEDAISDIKRKRVNQRFENTIRSRRNSRKTPIIIIMQRLHEEDLCGYLTQLEPDEWTVLSLPCLYKEEGEEKALWQKKHSVEELKRLREADTYTFDTQYQQNPMPLEGLLLPKSELRFADMSNIPDDIIEFRFSIGDPADTGGDKYSMPFLFVIVNDDDFAVYVPDVIHNKDGILVNSERIIDKVVQHRPEVVMMESNGVGLAGVMMLQQNLSAHTRVSRFTSTTNKEVRILSNYEFVKRYFVFNQDYESNREYAEFIKDLTSYLKEGTNTHRKDAIDILCAAAKALKVKYKSFFFQKK